MSKFDNSPVQPLKIQMINDILSHPTVSYYYHEWLRLKQIAAPLKDIDTAFRTYAKHRDIVGGLAPLVAIPDTQSTNKRYMR